MKSIWRTIRANWRWSDGLVLVSNTAVFLVFIGNCWWRSLPLCFAAPLGALALQCLRARRDGTLRDAVLFGAAVAAMWPLGEGVFVRVFGWWGEYLDAGPRIWETPLSCSLVGWLASTHCFYVARRALEMGYGRAVAAGVVGVTAFLIGLMGENFFVAAGIWVYRPSILDWWHIPAFLPVAYGLGYAIIPLARGGRLLPATVAFLLWLPVICAGLGWLTGYFPA